jgi:[acyl-carrier-protein] S-malonyltransferase
MAKAIYDQSAAAREVFQRADDALGWSLTRLCFEGPESELTLTANAQPAIVTASIATLSALKEAHPELSAPVVAAGHSLGEYSALVAAGALTLEDAVRLVHLRGTAMQQAVPEGEGAMAAIMGGDPDAVLALCRDAQPEGVVSPANYNAPGQIVIAGAARAVQRAAELASERKLKAIPLKVSAPFHCSLMAPAARAVETALTRVPVGVLTFPVISNVEARANVDSSRVAELLVRQIDGAVLWEPSVRAMAELGVTKAVEIGPGKVLAGLVRRITKSIDVLSVGDPEAVSRAAAFVAA